MSTFNPASSMWFGYMRKDRVVYEFDRYDSHGRILAQGIRITKAGDATEALAMAQTIEVNCHGNFTRDIRTVPSSSVGVFFAR